MAGSSTRSIPAASAGDVGGRHEHRRVADELLDRRARRRHERRAARERLERGQPEPLLERGIDDGRGAPEQRRHRVLVDVAGAHDAGRDAARTDRDVDVAVVPPVPAGEHEGEVGPGRRDAREGAHERRDVLARLDGAEERDVRRADREAIEAGEVGLLVGLGTEAHVVHAVRHDDHVARRTRRRDERRQPVGGVPADAHAHVGVRHRRRDHAPEVERLRSLVPLGMFEERQVVDGDDPRDRARSGTV